MRDIKEHLERLRVQKAECEMIRDLATDRKKREVFALLAEHYGVLARELEKAITDSLPPTVPGRNAQEPTPKDDKN